MELRDKGSWREKDEEKVRKNKENVLIKDMR